MTSRKSNHPRGRRPGPSTTRDEILAAARASFAAEGYAGTSVRGVAARADVDPALVHRFFGSKDGLLTAALQLAAQPGEHIPGVVEGDPETLGERVVGYFLRVWETPSSRDVMLAMLRSAATNERAAELLRAFVGREILGRVAAGLDPETAPMRAALAGSQLVGLATARYIVKLEPLASAPAEAVAAAVAPTVQRYLLGDVELPPPAPPSASI
jgi:AcrR family transcriptional regulator